MKVLVMCYLNLGSMLKILLEFLHLAKDFAQKIQKTMGQYKNSVIAQ